MADAPNDFRVQLSALEAELKRLEAEFTQFFAGRSRRPPWETRARVAAMVQRLDRAHQPNYGDRFKFSSVQARVSKLFEMWDRALRAREEGRTGPLSQGHPSRFIETGAEEPKDE